MECGWNGTSEATKERRNCDSCGLLVNSGDIARCRMNRGAVHRHQVATARAASKPPRVMVGTELKIIIAWFGEIPGGGCSSCSRLAAKMDAKGPDWCNTDGRPEIIAGMLSRRGQLEEAIRQHGDTLGTLAKWIPDSVLRIGAGALLTRAIESAKKRVSVS